MQRLWSFLGSRFRQFAETENRVGYELTKFEAFYSLMDYLV